MFRERDDIHVTFIKHIVDCFSGSWSVMITGYFYIIIYYSYYNYNYYIIIIAGQCYIIIYYIYYNYILYIKYNYNYYMII